MVAAFFSDISQLLFVLSLSDVYPYQHDCLLSCPWWRVQFLMTILLSRPINRYTLVSIYLSLGYFTSSNTAHDPIPIFRPFFLTSLLKFHSFATWKKGGFWFFGDFPSHFYVVSFYAGVFSTAKGHASDPSAFETLQHLLHTAPCPPCSLVWWRSYNGEIL